MKLKICLIILFLFSAIDIFAQNDGEVFQRKGTNINYDLDDWITYSMTRWVTSISEGRDYIYFGTTGGIIRYNMYSSNWDRTWTVSDGLPDNFIITVAYDFNTDYLWCSTSFGVSVFRTIWKRWENYFKDELGIVPGDDIVSIGFDDQNVWLQSRDGEIFRSQNQQGTFFRETGNSINFNKIKWSGENGYSENQALELYMTGNYFFDPRGFIRDTNLDEYKVTSYKLDHWNNIWVGTWGLGAAHADSRIKTLELIPYGLFIKNVAAFDFDDEGKLWAGGAGAYNGQSGITCWNFSNNDVRYFQSRFEGTMYSDQVTTMATDGDYVWIGTQYGLLRYNRARDEWKTFDTGLGLRDNWVLDVEVDSNVVWIGTILGLNVLEKDHMYHKNYRIKDVFAKDILNMRVYDVEAMENLLWIGTDYGLYVYDKKTKKGGFENDPNGPQNNRVTAVGILDTREVWLGLEDGVEVFDVQKKQWRGAPERRFQSTGQVNFIVVDDSAAWVGTNEGVLKFDKRRNRWRRFTVEDGLPANVVHYILLDGDFIWFGTPEGLTRFYWNSPYRID